MKRLDRSVGLLGFVSLCAVGCSQSVGGGDGGLLEDASPSGGRTQWFVMNSVAVSSRVRNVRFGFNVDGQFSRGDESSGCLHQDHLSAIDSDQNCRPEGNRCVTPCAANLTGCRGGVDNSLEDGLGAIGALNGINPEELLNTALRRSTMVLLVRVSDLDEGVGPNGNDPYLEIAAYVGQADFSTQCEEQVPNRTYRVVRSALRGARQSLQDAPYVSRGRLVNGRVVVEPGAEGTTFPFRIPWAWEQASGTTERTLNWRALSVQRAQFRFDLRADNTAANGNFGGFVPGEQLLSALSMVPPEQQMTWISVLGALVDLELNGTCFERTSRTFGGISGGFGFTMLPARVPEAPIADAPTPGSCGNSMP